MFTPGLAIFYLATILRLSHVCGVRTGFSNILSAGGSTLVPRHWSAVTRLLLHHHRDGGIIWTEPVKYWRKACLLACLDHTVLLQIMATSLILHLIIVLADDPRWKRRREANSTSNHIKKMLLLSICYKCPTLDNRYK